MALPQPVDMNGHIGIIHYFPGAVMPVEDIPDEGYFLDFDNLFCKLLPGPPDHGPGYDAGRPTDEDGTVYNFIGNGGGTSDILFNFTGTGQWVDFYLLGLGPQGPGIQLSVYDGDTWSQAPMPDNGYLFGGNGRAVSGNAPVTPGYPNSAALRVYLVEDAEYLLQVVSATFSSDVANAFSTENGYAGFDQHFHLEVRNTPRQLNDHRADAFDVAIARDGDTYNSVPVMNTTFSTSTSDDISGVFASAWWKYEPTADCTMAVNFAIIPQGQPKFQCIAYVQNPDATLTMLASESGNVGAFTVPLVHAGDTIYLQVSSFSSTNDAQPYAQWYQLEVTGVTSAVQNFFARVDEDTWLRTAIPTQPLRLRLSNTQWKTFAGGNQGILKTRSKDHQWLAVGTAGSRYGVVKGYVIAGGTIVVNHFVWVEDSAGTVTPYTAWTDTNGYFEIIGVPLGHAYTVKVRIRETYPDVVWDDPFHPTNDDPVHTPAWWADGPAVTGIT